MVQWVVADLDSIAAFRTHIASVYGVNDAGHMKEITGAEAKNRAFCTPLI